MRRHEWHATRAAPQPIGFWRRLGRGIGRIFGARYYDAGKTTSRFREFSTKAAGPNTITQSMGGSLRNRARDMVRNDAHCARAVSVLVNNLVGTGLVPTAIGSKDDQRVQARADVANAWWAWWGQRGQADVEGQHTIDGLIATAVRGLVESGEVLVRRVVDRSAGRVPYRLEILEAELLDESKTEPTDGGGQIVQGVELDARGRRVAYWLLPQHPGEGTAIRSAYRPSVRVPAEDVIHLFVPLRPRQIRGIPWLAPVLASKRDLADYEAYELLRKKTEAAVVAFVIPPEGFEGDTSAADEEDGIAPSVEDADGNLVEDLQPGLIARLRRGKDVRFNQPTIPGGYPEYKRAMLQSIAVGAGVSYEQLTGDLSQANYSSLRAGLLEFWRLVEMYQWTHIVPVLCDRLWSWCMEGAYLTGALDTPTVPVEWSAPRRQSVDPSKDTLADVMDVRALFVPLDDKIAERGYQPRAMLKRVADMNAALDELGLISDADPRKMAFRGASPPSSGTAAEGITPLGEEAEDAAEETA